MTHEEIKEKVLLLRDEELSDANKSEVLVHLTGCSSCRELQAAVEGIGSAIASEPTPEPSESFISAVMDRLPEEEVPVRDGIELPFRWWAPAFATGIAGLMLLVSSPEAQQPVTVETLLTASAGISPDGNEDIESPDVADVLGISVEEL